LLPDTLLGLVLLALAAFWAWETVLSVLPIALPAWLQPFLVLGIAYGAQYLSEPLLWAAAAAGAVGLLHTWARSEVETQPLTLQRPRRSTPVLPGRVPDLP
jgi:hypothetical protein